jgi:hypothetical protein
VDFRFRRDLAVKQREIVLPDDLSGSALIKRSPLAVRFLYKAPNGKLYDTIEEAVTSIIAAACPHGDTEEWSAPPRNYSK